MKIKSCAAFVLGSLLSFGALAQDAAPMMDNLTLEDLLNVSVEIAGKKKQSQEQAVSIVSVITRNDIETYGYRDLSDILMSVPGFQMGIDALSIYGTSFRGIWGHEGKILIMVNGVQVQDFAFGLDNQIGSYPASMMDRVEIIRGPGSALYGGFAEVAVINIITREMPDANTNFILGATVGAMGEQFARSVFASSVMNVGDKKLSAHIGYNHTPTSDKTYKAFDDSELDMGNGPTPRMWRHVITKMEDKDWALQYTNTSFTYFGQDGYFYPVIEPVNGINQEKLNQSLQTVTATSKYSLGDKWKLLPKVEYTTGNNSNTSLLPAATVTFDLSGTGVTITRTLAELGASYLVSPEAEVLLGAGYINDGVENIADDGSPGLQYSPDTNDVGSEVNAESKYGYAQYLHQWSEIGFVGGARYESTEFGDAFAPRTGVTYVKNRFNSKLLWGRAFRVPMPWQTYSRFLTYPAEKLKPETTDSIEVEVGYKFSSNFVARLNGFLVKTKDPLVYNSVTLGYENFGEIESRGFEAELAWKHPTYGASANIAYAKPSDKTSDGFLTTDESEFLGMAPFKVNLMGYYKMGKFTFGPSASYMPKRQGQSKASALSTTIANSDYDAVTVLNLNVTANQVWKNMDMFLSVHNITDSDQELIQPYYGAHAPMPVNDRQISLGVTMKL